MSITAIERKEKARMLEGELSSMTARMFGRRIHGRSERSADSPVRPLHLEQLILEEFKGSWEDRFNQMRAGFITASLRKRFPERYETEDGEPTLEADYIVDQLREVDGLEKMPFYLLGDFFGKTLSKEKK